MGLLTKRWAKRMANSTMMGRTTRMTSGTRGNGRLTRTTTWTQEGMRAGKTTMGIWMGRMGRMGRMMTRPCKGSGPTCLAVHQPGVVAGTEVQTREEVAPGLVQD